MVLTGICVLLYVSRERHIDEKLKDDLKKGVYVRTKIIKDSNIAERTYFLFLRKNYYDRFIVLPQARLSQFITVQFLYKDHRYLFELLGQKSVDFLLIDITTFEPVVAIEINGMSHFPFEVKRKDKTKRDLLERLKIKYLAVAAKNEYDEKAEKNRLDAVLNSTTQLPSTS